MVAESLIRVVACGSVDDGKSTLIGRLLAMTGSVPIDQLEMVRHARRTSSELAMGEIDYSLLTDGLEAERFQGITIDVAYRHLVLPNGRRLIIADAPGHEQYTRNMVVAASTAHVALLLVDSTKGVRSQTYRHLTICAILGIQTVVIVINKMDRVSYSAEVFRGLAAEVVDAAQKLGLRDVRSLPIVALTGDNVVEPSHHMSWFEGPSLLETLNSWVPVAGNSPSESQLRLPIQLVLRTPEGRRTAVGTITAGALSLGDRLALARTGDILTIRRIFGADGDLGFAVEGTPVAVEFDSEIDLARGDILVPSLARLMPADRWAADLVWLGDTPLAHGRSYLLQCGPISVPGIVTRVRHRIDIATGKPQLVRSLAMNEIGRVELAMDRPIALDPYDQERDTGGFILIDRVTSDTVAAGLTRFALRRASTISPYNFNVDGVARERMKNQRGQVIWLTGLSGAGKSTLADATERRLHAQGFHTYVLDGDNIRFGLTSDLGFTPEDRAENVRRVSEVARILVDAGLVVIVALVSPFRIDRRRAREIIGVDRFTEVWVHTPLETCIDRDTKGLYSRAARGALPNLTGLGQDYEPPEEAEIVLDGTGVISHGVDVLLARVLATNSGYG